MANLLASAGVALLLATANSSAASEGPLATATHAVAHDLDAPGTTLVVASPLVSDVPAPRAEELTNRVASLVAAAVGPGARSAAHPMSLAAARALSAKAGALVYIDVRVAEGELRLTADLYPVVANAWDRVRAPSPPPTKHSYVHVRVAAEVRSFLAPIRLEQAHLTKFTHDMGTVLALACGEIESGAGNALAVVSEREIAWGHLAQGRFVATRRVPAGTVGLRTATPMREPMASAAIVGRDDGREDAAALYVGWTGRVGGALGSNLVPRSRVTGLPTRVSDTVFCLVPSSAKGAFDGLVDCADGRTPVADMALPVPLFDAWSAADIPSPEGTVTRVIAARDPMSALHLARGHDALTVNDVGAQLALGDLDQDGVVEVVTTAATGDDAIVVSSWRPTGLVPRLRFPAPRGVDALAVCLAEVGDAPALVAAVGQEIWLVR